jgi:hypothetical protein
VVFHDSFKARKNLYYTLPQVLEKYSKDYQFLPIVKSTEMVVERIAV